MADPESYMYNKRVETTKIGAREHEEAMDEGRFDDGPLVKRKRSNRYYQRPNKFVPVKKEVLADGDLSGSDCEGAPAKKKKKKSDSSKDKAKKKAAEKGTSTGKKTKTPAPKPSLAKPSTSKSNSKQKSKPSKRSVVPVASDKYGVPVKVTYGKGNTIPVPSTEEGTGGGEDASGEYLVELKDNGKSSDEEASSSEEESGEESGEEGEDSDGEGDD